VQRGSAQDSRALPAPLNEPTPRQVRVNASGVSALIAAMALTAAGVWGEIEFYTRAKASERLAALFAHERLVTGAEVTRIQRRGGGNNRRSTVHYQYAAQGRDYTGATTVSRSDRDRYVAGAPVAVWYLPSQSDASWLDGYAPSPAPMWPVMAIPVVAGFAALSLIVLVRRQLNLLTNGRPALAVITKVERKRTDKGSFWRVHYEWTLLSGATRTGRYKDSGKQPPALGATIPIVYDKDDPSRNSKYPLGLVSISKK